MWKVSLANKISETSNGHWEFVGGRGQEGISVELDREIAKTMIVEDSKLKNLADLARIQEAAERMYQRDRAFPYMRGGRFPYKKICIDVSDLADG